MKHGLKLFVIVSIVFTAVPVYSDSFRCGSNLVSAGDDKATVVMKCGKPIQTDYDTLRCTEEFGVVRCRKIEEWTYNPGSGKLLTTLIFEGSKLIAFRAGARVP